MRTSHSSRHSENISRSTRGRGSGSSRTRRHNPPPSAPAPVPDIAPRKYRTWDIETQDVAVFFAFGLRRPDASNPDRDYGRMATGEWESLADLNNELMAIDNYQCKLLNTELLRFRIRTSFGQRALNQLEMTSGLPTTPSRKWVRNEFLDVV